MEMSLPFGTKLGDNITADVVIEGRTVSSVNMFTYSVLWFAHY